MLFRNIFVYFTRQRPCHSPCKLCMATSMIQVNFVPPNYMARIANNKEHAASSKPPNSKTQHPHQHQSSWVDYEIQTIQIHFLKLFLTSDSAYLMYLVRHLVDMKSSFTASLCDSSKCSFISCVQV